MDDHLQQALDWRHWIYLEDGSVNVVSLSVLVAFLGGLVFLLLQTRRKPKLRGDTVLLVGPSDAGKTAIFTQLAYSTSLPSHTSTQVNSGVFTLADKPVKISDVPGHPRLRATQKEQIVTEAKAVVFVVDASTIARNGAVVAEHLHVVLHTLSSLPFDRVQPQLVIHAHKCDLLVVRSNTPSSSVSTKSRARGLAKERVKAVLERELEKRAKAARIGVSVDTEEGGEGATAMGGLECTGGDGPFRFDNWEGGDVEFTGGWVDVVRDDGIVASKPAADAEEDGLVEVKDWLGVLPL